ncbi:MAG: sigma-54 dependent transcriptional regulator [Deltaproteobacteria bacterium]|nr:sigma-54 dependent transcriptional regulator [Deltaproteobacteria bacterium]
MNILVVDDEEVYLTSMKRLLRWHGMKDVDTCANGQEAIRRIKEKDYDIVLLDLLMPGVDGLKVLEETKPFKPHTEFIIVTAVDAVSQVVKAIRMGAYDYLIKPVDNEHLVLSIERAYERRGLIAGLNLSRYEKDGEIPGAFGEIITQCPRMKALLSYAQVMARSGNPILVTGASGTGKELLARGLHRAGPSPGGPFVPVNISSIPETLFESQFFGHIKGAFTGATRDYQGYFEQANGGTLFLDEIGEFPHQLQAKLLRVLEEKTFSRIGETKPIRVDVRIVSATNMDLDKACQEGRFRLDLIYRVRSAVIHLPPLREREGDISLLAAHFLKQSAARYGKDVRGFSPEAMDILLRKDYPGNIRQLSQIVENAVLLADSTTIAPRQLGEEVPPPSLVARSLVSLKENYEMQVVFVFNHFRGDRKQTAQVLGITVRQLQRKLAEMKKSARWKNLIGDF